jgi:uncharacterized protein (DUF302 family)
MLDLLNARGRALMLGLGLLLTAPAAVQADIAPREGWNVLASEYSYDELVARVDEAAAAHRIGVVTRASATVGARQVLDMEIPGNMVIGLYHPRFAVPMLEASVAAGIEAPIRVYVTEDPDGTATLSYKEPSFVFAPYMDEGGDALRDLAAELDELFAELAAQAAGN